MYFFFLATAYEGAMADINTYDQPGVEDYKKILRKYLQKYMKDFDIFREKRLWHNEDVKGE